MLLGIRVHFVGDRWWRDWAAGWQVSLFRHHLGDWMHARAGGFVLGVREEGGAEAVGR